MLQGSFLDSIRVGPCGSQKWCLLKMSHITTQVWAKYPLATCMMLMMHACMQACMYACMFHECDANKFCNASVNRKHNAWSCMLWMSCMHKHSRKNTTKKRGTRKYPDVSRPLHAWNTPRMQQPFEKKNVATQLVEHLAWQLPTSILPNPCHTFDWNITGAIR